MARWAKECWILMSRNARVLLADRQNLWMLLLQTPIIVALTVLAFRQFASDDRPNDFFVRAVHYFHVMKAPYEQSDDAVPVYRVVLPRARQAAAGEEHLISVPTAQRRASVYFVLVSAAIWIGLMGSCREIVTEQHVLFREARTCIRLLPICSRNSLSRRC